MHSTYIHTKCVHTRTHHGTQAGALAIFRLLLCCRLFWDTVWSLQNQQRVALGEKGSSDRHHISQVDDLFEAETAQYGGPPTDTSVCVLIPDTKTEPRQYTLNYSVLSAWRQHPHHLTKAVHVVAVHQAEPLPAGRDVLQAYPTLVLRRSHVFQPLFVPRCRRCCCRHRRAPATSRTGPIRGACPLASRLFYCSCASATAGLRGVRRPGRRSGPLLVKKLAAVPVAAAPGLLEEAAHRQPLVARVVREGAGVSELALSLLQVMGDRQACGEER